MFERQEDDASSIPFRFGVFIGASLPFNADDESGKEEWQAAAKSGKDVIKQFKGELELKGQPGMITFPDIDDRPVWVGRYHSQKTPKAKLRIPVLHIIGKKDPYAAQARELATNMHENAFDSLLLEHEGGHEVPREPLVNDKIAQQMSRMMAMLAIPAC